MGSSEMTLTFVSDLIHEYEKKIPRSYLRDKPGLVKDLEFFQLCLAQQRLPNKSKIESAIRRLQQSLKKVENRKESLPNPSFPGALPVSERCEEIVRAIQHNQVVIIAGETGSGKTTQIPKMCLAAGLGTKGFIGCSQPRRVAAHSISKRVAEELEVEWGKTVGCKVRFNDDTSSETFIKFLTDGMLLAEAQGDPKLLDYEVLIIDEAHERSLNIDFILGYLRNLIDERPELKIIITSATIDTKAFSKAFNEAPIIEVSGKVFPVEIIYQPWDEEDLEYEYGFVEAAVDAVESLLHDPSPGDFLVFMPGERDIRECRDQMEARYGGRLEILPLFGRLSSAEQQRIFSSSLSRRVVIATNIAETSVTIPNIRFVIDCGLARMSRYSPRTRTKRLPIEPISQSSANQRKGRCGRVQDGICVRLYSEEDFLERPKFTQPELQRCNLAEVILKMKAFHLGDIESFPFLNPPQEKAIKNGYKLLQELGALDQHFGLTPLGKRLARLPVDPMIGRMVIQASEENALHEVVIIASGLSIQDPKERPLEQEKQADAAHQVFRDENSDFITMLNLWNVLHENAKNLRSQNQLRKFCKKNFISFIRFREWRDIHTQLKYTLREIGGFKFNKSEAGEDAIHRSILTGLIIQTGFWVEKNWYKSPGNRKVMAFPGSVVFRATTSRERKLKNKGKLSQKSSDRAGQPRWIVAGEFLETSQLFARNNAKIRPEWIIEFGEHLCQFTYFEPRWDKKSSRVVVNERVALKGLEVIVRSVDLKKINPVDATDIFIREALVEGQLNQVFPFMEHNKGVINEIQNWQRRMRDVSMSRLDDRIYDYYHKKFQGAEISSIHDFNKQLKEWNESDPHYLNMSLGDIIQDTSLEIEKANYPDQLSCAGHIVDFEYSYSPGEKNDGVTIFLPAILSMKVTQALLDWLVPGYRYEKVENLLRLLPRQFRKELMPISETAQEIVGDLKPKSKYLSQDLSNWIRINKKIDIPPSIWEWEKLPEYLQVKVGVVDKNGKTQFQGKDIFEFQSYLQNQSASAHKGQMVSAVRSFERHDVRTWDFGDLPEHVEINTPGARTSWIFPGLYLEGGLVHVRTFRSLKDAKLSSTPAYRRLGSLALGKEMLWLEKDLLTITHQNLDAVTYPDLEYLVQDVTEFCLRILFPASNLWPLKKNDFESAVIAARASIPNLGKWVAGKVTETLRLRQEILSHTPGPSIVRDDLQSLLPKRFFRNMQSKEELSYLPRSLKARLIRVQRAKTSPSKDQSKWEKVRPWHALSEKWQKSQHFSPESIMKAREFRGMVEEYYISIFAQDLGTRFSISGKKLENFVKESHRLGFLRLSNTDPKKC